MSNLIAGRYKLTGASNSGGMGEIIECEDTHLKRKVIVKRLQNGVDTKRIIDEQKALTKLRSKHVVQLYDVVTMIDRNPNEKAIVLEYIGGSNLEVNAYTPNIGFLKVIWQIACGLRDIHSANIIHRDIKPNNIRLDDEGVVKIIDFGLARSNGVEAKTKGAVGTPVFMAPELWSRSTVNFDSSIDVYAFGVTVISLLSGHLPDSLMEMPPRGVTVSDLSGHVVGLPSGIVQILSECLAVVPNRRPTMANIESILSKQILSNQHKALVIMNGKEYHLTSSSRSIVLNANAIGGIVIEYNGFDFMIKSANGNVFINNDLAKSGDVMPGCCVITFGQPGGVRRFVTFDVSNPEVMS